MCVTAPWPEPRGARDPDVEAKMARVMGVVTAIRNVRTVAKVKPSDKPDAFVQATGLDDEQRRLVVTLARLGELTTQGQPPAGSLRGVAEGGDEVFVQVSGDILVDLERQLGKVRKELDRSEAKLANPSFVERAPEAVVAKERGIQQELADRMAKIEENIASLRTSA